MSGIVLTAYSGAILGPIAKFLGWIMNGIYLGMYHLFGIQNVGLCIVLLTILIYLFLLPLTIKQQKFSKLSQKMQPEIQAIQAKYKNKKDQASMQAMNEETQLVYEKYGVSPTGSCIQLLIQMPILFALYRVFYNVPAYITSVKDTFGGLVDGIQKTDGFVDSLTNLVTQYNVVTSSNITANSAADVLSKAEGSVLSDYIVDILYKLPSYAWDADSKINSAKGLTSLFDTFPSLSEEIGKTWESISQFNYVGLLNISDTPWNIITTNFEYKTAINDNWLVFIICALLVPILSYVTQIINIKMMPQSSNQNDQMAQQMKTMNMMMPLMSLFIAFTVPVGLAIYWIAGAVVRGVQQFFVNKHIENLDLDDIIKANQEKAKKKREKMGIAENQIREAAALKTRNMQSKANTKTFVDNEMELEKANSMKMNAKAGSMASKANLVKDFNERNNRK